LWRKRTADRWQIGRKSISAVCALARLAAITISPVPIFLRYSQEAALRGDDRSVSNGDQVSRVATLAMARGPSIDFAGYWQRHVQEDN
jgi:hypothetical protein